MNEIIENSGFILRSENFILFDIVLKSVVVFNIL